jgi:hypothetical protein
MRSSVSRSEGSELFASPDEVRIVTCPPTAGSIT